MFDEFVKDGWLLVYTQVGFLISLGVTEGNLESQDPKKIIQVGGPTQCVYSLTLIKQERRRSAKKRRKKRKKVDPHTPLSR